MEGFKWHSLLLAILFTFFPFLSAYDYEHVNVCEAEIFIRVADDVAPFDSCENFVDHIHEHFHRVATELYKSSNKRLALRQFVVDVPSSWRYTCYHKGALSKCRRHDILLTDQDLQPFIHRNLECDNYEKHSSLIISYERLSGKDLPSQFWRAFEYRHYHNTNNDVDVCNFEPKGPDRLSLKFDPCVYPDGFQIGVELASYQYYDESLMTLDIKSRNDKNVYNLSLQPKLNGHWLDNIKVSATIKLGKRSIIIRADKQDNGNFTMKIGNLFGPGTYEVSFNVQGNDARGYPDEADQHPAKQHCGNDYRDPRYVHVGTFNWTYPRTEEYTIAPVDQHVTTRSHELTHEVTSDGFTDEESTTPKPTDQEPPNDPTILYIVAPIVVLAVAVLFSYIFYGKDKLKRKESYDEDTEEGGGFDNENGDE